MNPSTTIGAADTDIDLELDAFVRVHYPRLIRLAALVGHEPLDASDAVQNALERAWRRRSALRDPAALRGWLDRTVVREAIRLNRPPRLSLHPFGRPREIDLSAEIEDPQARHEADTQLRIAFDSLGVDQRVVLVLHLYAGYTVEETAAIVGAPIETVRARLRRGRVRLRTLLGDAP
jgi:RNA polymerase sigma-70 factor, ECF subfamily